MAPPTLDRPAMQGGIVAASGGNHGIATARAGFMMAGVKTTIFLPSNASPAKIEKLEAWGAATRIVGIEAAGSPVLLRGLEPGHNMALDKITTSVATMACARTDDRIFEIVQRNVDEIVFVDDAEMLRAAKGLWFEMGLAADLSGAATIAARAEGRVRVGRGERICAIVCGAGPDAILG